MTPHGRVAAALALALAGVAASDAPDADVATRVPVAEDYALSCAGCHGLDGRGTRGVTPSLHGLAALLDAPTGRAYLARVPGVAQAPLSDARLARVLNWVLERWSDAGPEPPYTAREVGRLRAVPLRDTVAARAAVVRDLP